MTKTYTEAEQKAAVDEAVAVATAELTARLSTLEATSKQSEVDAAVEAALIPVKAELADVRTQLDTATAEAKTEREAREALETFLKEAGEAAERAAEIATLKTERSALVAATNAFDAEYCEENAERWASMSAEEFDGRLADYTAAGAKNGTGSVTPAGEIPKVTAMSAASGGDTKTKTSVTSVTRELIEATRPGWSKPADK